MRVNAGRLAAALNARGADPSPSLPSAIIADIKAGVAIPLAEMRLHDGVARLRVLQNKAKASAAGNGTSTLWTFADFALLDPAAIDAAVTEEVLVANIAFAQRNADAVARFVVALGAGYAFCRDNAIAAASTAFVVGDNEPEIWAGVGVLAAEALGAAVFNGGKFGSIDRALLNRTRALANNANNLAITSDAVARAFDESYLSAAMA